LGALNDWFDGRWYQWLRHHHPVSTATSAHLFPGRL